MNILAICTGYPTKENPYNCTWAHTRNRYYSSYGINVNVLIPHNSLAYEIDGVRVIPHDEALEKISRNHFDVVLSHSPNIRAHIPLLKKIKNRPMVLFMHGSESMSINRDYPAPYPYQRAGLTKRIARDLYDLAKFIALKHFILKNKKSIHIVFVSQWMKETFCKNVFSVTSKEVPHTIINNSLNENFISQKYTAPQNPIADFVTLRRLDHSKFCIDLIVESARKNPGKTYHIYGVGSYFDHFEKPKNITVFSHHIETDKIPEILNRYSCALMPTRCDAQGVMACEIAAYGMPLITSDISVSREMFSDFGNVHLLPLERFGEEINLSAIDFSCDEEKIKSRFSTSKTLEAEVSLIKRIGGFSL